MAPPKTNKKQLILDTALKLFSKKGFDGTSMSLIAKTAGVAKGLPYNFFESKQAILKALIDSKINKWVELMTSFEINNAKEHLNKIFRAYKEDLKENKASWKLFISISMQQSSIEILGEEFLDLSNTIITKFSTYLSTLGYKEPASRYLYLNAILDGITMNYIAAPIEYPLDYCFEEYIREFHKPAKNE
jgi:AcrR family transcriptional regulator